MALPYKLLVLGLVLFYGAFAGADPPNMLHCAPGQSICPSFQAFCDSNNDCVCRSGHGNGRFFCHTPDEVFCHISNDPRAQTFSGDSFGVPLPCRYVASKAAVSTPQYSCATTINVLQSRVKGKYFVTGFDAKVEFSGMGVTLAIEGGATGTLNHTTGKYNYNLFMISGADHHNITIVDNRVDIPIEGADAYGDILFEETGDGHVLLKIDLCGINTKFRAGDLKVGKEQPIVPGIAIAYFLPPGGTMEIDPSTICLSPEVNRATIEEEYALSPLAEIAFETFGLMTYREPPFYMRPYFQYNLKCDELSDVVNTCVNNKPTFAAVAAEHCHFILAKPLFANYYSKFHNEAEGSAEKVLELLSTCIQAFCTPDTELCESVQDQIIAAGVADHADEGFMNHACAFVI